MTTKYKIIGQSLVFGVVLVLSLSFLLARPTPAAAACSADSLGECTQDQCVANGGVWGYQGSVMTCHKATDSGSGGTYTPNPDSGNSSGNATRTGTGEDEPVVDSTDPAAKGGDCAEVKSCGLVTKYINPFVNFLAALVGVAITISIIIGGIQYGSSAGDPQAVTAAKNRIRNAIIALLTFILLWALLNFLIPGGLV